jgi:hypothetical protein
MTIHKCCDSDKCEEEYRGVCKVKLSQSLTPRHIKYRERRAEWSMRDATQRSRTKLLRGDVEKLVDKGVDQLAKIAAAEAEQGLLEEFSDDDNDLEEILDREGEDNDSDDVSPVVEPAETEAERKYYELPSLGEDAELDSDEEDESESDDEAEWVPPTSSSPPAPVVAPVAVTPAGNLGTRKRKFVEVVVTSATPAEVVATSVTAGGPVVLPVDAFAFVAPAC